MRPLLPVFLVLFFSLPLLAQSSDPSLSIIEVSAQESASPDRVALSQTMNYRLAWSGIDLSALQQVTFEVDTPFFPFSIADDLGALQCNEGTPVRCTFRDSLQKTSGIAYVTFRASQPGTFTSVFRLLTNGAADPNPANNVVSHTFEVVSKPVLRMEFLDPLPAVLEPGQEFPFHLYLRTAGVPATNVVLTMTLPQGGTFVTATSTIECSTNATTLTCTIPWFYGNPQQIDGTIRAPQRESGEDFVAEIALTSTEEDFDPSDNQRTLRIPMRRQFIVTNTADEGGGSLRQTIHDVNALCPIPVPCGIVFRIPAPVPQSGWFTIRPQTVLPQIDAAVKIDGTAQTAFTGDTNLEGPEIEIAGEQLFEESGLRLVADCTTSVQGLAINGFRGYGIYVRRNELADAQPCVRFPLTTTITDNYIGTDPTGRVARPNHRGLGLFGYAVYVRNNLISGNARSGIYAGDSHYTEISKNEIGVASDGSPLGNGAGIMFDLARVPFRRNADVTENVIAHNDMAVARTREGEIFISRNGIFDNVQQGIDVDLDAITPNRFDDSDMPNRPVLFSATYDPVRGVTFVRGRIDSVAFWMSRYIEVFTSTRNSAWSLPQAEHSVEMHRLGGLPEFEIVLPGDLRGQWITAAYHVRWSTDLGDTRANTSELSDALLVH